MAPVLEVSAGVNGKPGEVVEGRRDAVEEAFDCNAAGIRSVTWDHGVGILCEFVVVAMATIFGRNSEYN
jgi:hypothetical protein